LYFKDKLKKKRENKFSKNEEVIDPPTDKCLITPTLSSRKLESFSFFHLTDGYKSCSIIEAGFACALEA